MLHVLYIQVRGSDIGASTKPPLSGQSLPLLSLKVPKGQRIKKTSAYHGTALLLKAGTVHAMSNLPVVEVHCGSEGVLRVHHRRDASSEEGNTANTSLGILVSSRRPAGTIHQSEHESELPCNMGSHTSEPHL